MSKTKWERSTCQFRSCNDMHRGSGGDNRYAGMCARHYRATRDIEKAISWELPIGVQVEPVSLRGAIRARYKQLSNHAAGFCASDCNHNVALIMRRLKEMQTDLPIDGLDIVYRANGPACDITPGRIEFESLDEYEERVGPEASPIKSIQPAWELEYSNQGMPIWSYAR